MPFKLRPTGLGSEIDSKSQRGILRKGGLQSEPKSGCGIHSFCVELAVTPLDQRATARSRI